MINNLEKLVLSSKTSGPKNLTENHTAFWEEATYQQEKTRMAWGERKGGVQRTWAEDGR